MSTLDLRVYEIFKSKLGEKEAETEIEYFETKTETKYQEKKDILLTKDDKVDLIDRINKAKLETIIWIVGIGVLQFVMSIVAKNYF